MRAEPARLMMGMNMEKVVRMRYMFNTSGISKEPENNMNTLQ